MMKCDKKKCLLALVFLSSLLMSLKVYSNEPETNWKYVELVNPFVDSHRSRWFFFSSACRPFGMVLIQIRNIHGDRVICMALSIYDVLAIFIIGRCPVLL